MDKSQAPKVIGLIVLVLAAAIFGFKSCQSAEQAANPETVQQKNPSPPDSFKAGAEGGKSGDDSSGGKM